MQGISDYDHIRELRTSFAVEMKLCLLTKDCRVWEGVWTL